MKKNFEWYKKKTIYQIWPRSFRDSNGDGIGDLRGIMEKIPYLHQLGIELLWLSPVYKSPMDDMGYDISDYYRVDPIFGTEEDMDALIAEAKKYNIGIIMDLVVNHTSDEHPWFVDARSSKDSPYRDYYIWKDPVDGKEPTDQRSFFYPSAWTYDENSGQYYYHLFSKRQPDLNWENEEVLKEVCKIMNFWLDRGIAGFRMDVIELLGKEPMKKLYTSPKVHEYLKEIFRYTLANYEETVTVGETGSAGVEDAIKYSGNKDELDMIFGFEHISLDEVEGKTKWHLKDMYLPEFKKVFEKWQKGLHNKGWNSIYLGNHDQPRPVSRWGNDQEYRVESAKCLANTFHMMQGTPYVYQGEEIGMTNVKFDSISDYKDLELINFYEEYKDRWSHEEIMKSIYAKGRDNARTPVQWNSDENAGFSEVEPWIKLSGNHKEINVEKDMANPDSIWNFYKKLISLRKERDIITYGDFELIDGENEKVFAFVREYKGEKLYVISNWSEEEVIFDIEKEIKDIDILTSNYKNVEIKREMRLRPYETLAFIEKN
jgi:oligo-1,6-glucosidase/glucan 1,6-alpha-glucosidase